MILLFVYWPAAGCSRAARAPRHAFRRVSVLSVVSLSCSAALRVRGVLVSASASSFFSFPWPLRGLDPWCLRCAELRLPRLRRPMVHRHDDGGCAPGRWVLPLVPCPWAASPAAGRKRCVTLHGLLKVLLRLRRRFVDGMLAVWVSEWTSRSALVASGVKNRNGVAIRPGRQPLRSNSSPGAEQRCEKRDGPSPAPQASSKVTQDHYPATHPTGAQPHQRSHLHQPSMCTKHLPPAAGQTPPPHTASNKHIPGGTHCRPQSIKGPLQATPTATCAEHGTTQKFLAESSGKPRHIGKAAAHRTGTRERATGPSRRDHNACAWGPNMFSAVHQIYRGEASAGFPSPHGAIRGFVQRIKSCRKP